MSKTSLCIQMLEILYSRNVVGISQLADVLETNPRNIPEYKKELETAGYFIDTVLGRYGGYRLDKRNLFPTVRLTEQEKNGLYQGFDYLLARNDFLCRDSLSSAISKVSSAIMSTDMKYNDVLVANRFPLSMEQNDLEKRFSSVFDCISKKMQLEIEYLTLNNEVSNRVIHPYKLYMYNNSWFVLAFDELEGNIRYFKINRIQNYQILTKHFRVLYTYKQGDYLDEYGMKMNGEWHPIKLKLTGPFAMLVKERTFGKEQIIEVVDSQTTILTCTMQNKDIIIRLVMGFGNNCEVLEPAWLKNDIATIVREMATAYNGGNNI